VSRRLSIWSVFLLLASAGFAAGPRIELVWPTPNTAYLEGKPYEAYVQPTVSGELTSALFGCVRSSGTQFHEGLDLKPISRDRRGEATDEIFATMAGVVRHVNVRAGDSGYGRYVVIEHTHLRPAVVTLYAHLSAVAPGLKAGDAVALGQVIGTMGRSAGGYTIPKERAHLHYEIGVMMTRRFQSWYDWKKFGSRNEQGLYNGMNIMGIDPLDFFGAFRARRVNNFEEYFAQMPAVAWVRIATAQVPDFVERYPELLTSPMPAEGVSGWDMKVNATGLPFSWTPLPAADVTGMRENEVRLIEVDADALRNSRCRSIAVSRRGGYAPGRDLETMLQLVFGLR